MEVYSVFRSLCLHRVSWNLDRDISLVFYCMLSIQILLEGFLRSNSGKPGSLALVAVESEPDFRGHLSRRRVLRDEIEWCDRGACGAHGTISQRMLSISGSYPSLCPAMHVIVTGATLFVCNLEKIAKELSNCFRTQMWSVCANLRPQPLESMAYSVLHYIHLPQDPSSNI